MVAWLATSQSGGVYVVANAGGTNNQRISTPELEYWLAKYTVAQIGAAVAYSYTDQGHIFYVLVIGNDTWVYDFVTQLWHQRSSNGGPHAVQYYAWFNGIHYVAGPSIGLAQMGMDFYSELGGTIYRTLISPTLGDDESRISYQSVQIDMERGTTPLLTGQGSNPQLMLSWSDDAGHSYSNEVMGSVGQQGNYTQRVIFRRLGRAFRRTFKIRITDPIKVVLIAATVKTE
jgi:hypothetical protein